MKRKDILELKKRFKKEQCTITRLCGCFVDTEKNIVSEFNETFLNLNEEDYFKYLDIAKKVLSGTVGNNLMNLHFPTEGLEISNRQESFINLKKSKLKNDEIIDELYKNIIDNYQYEGNYLILLFHDVYDIVTKTSDNIRIDESEEVFEYVLCGICPVTLSAPGLSYNEEESIFKSRPRDWVVEAPINGFVYPAFVDRGADIGSIIYYTKNPKDIHTELIEDVLGCLPKDTFAIQRDTFQAIVEASVNADEREVSILYGEVQENLNHILEDHKTKYEGIDVDPIELSKNDLEEILEDSGFPEESTSIVKEFYEKNFSESLPLVEGLIDKKVLRGNEQFKAEKALKKQVDFLTEKIEQIDSIKDEDYDIILQARPDKINQIKSEIIDGQEYILIPVNENEKTTILEL